MAESDMVVLLVLSLRYCKLRRRKECEEESCHTNELERDPLLPTQSEDGFRANVDHPSTVRVVVHVQGDLVLPPWGCPLPSWLCLLFGLQNLMKNSSRVFVKYGQRGGGRKGREGGVMGEGVGRTCLSLPASPPISSTTSSSSDSSSFF